MKYFSTFSGIGGFEIGIPSDFQCVGYSEICPYAIRVYKNHFPLVKNYGDISKIKSNELPEFDLLVGGFPCQSFSIAGNRKGFADTRGTLFFDVARIIEEKRPECILLENVKGLLSHDKGRTYKAILSKLTELDYDTESLVFDSYFFGGAPRKRVYMLSYDRKQISNNGDRKIKTKSLYACFEERVRAMDEQESEKIMRTSSRIVRTFARLPDWLDRDRVFHEEKKPNRKLDNT